MNGNRDLLLLQKVMNEPIYDNQCPEYIISIGIQFSFNRANCEIGELRYLFSASKGKSFFFQCIVLINNQLSCFDVVSTVRDPETWNKFLIAATLVVGSAHSGLLATCTLT